MTDFGERLADIVRGQFFIGACRVRNMAGLAFYGPGKTGVLLPMPLADAETLVGALQKRIAEAREAAPPVAPTWRPPAARWAAGDGAAA